MYDIPPVAFLGRTLWESQMDYKDFPQRAQACSGGATLMPKI